MKSKYFEKIVFHSLSTKRLNLSPIKLVDIEDIFILYSDKQLLKYTDNDVLANHQECERFIQKLEFGLAANEHVYWGIHLKEKPGVIGVLGLYNIDWKHRFAISGTLLKKEYWNLGIMTEAQAALVRFGFEQLKLNRIESQVFIGNLPSCRKLEKLGFSFEGKLKENFLIDGKFEDSFIFAIIYNEYLKISVNNENYSSIEILYE